MTKIMTQYGYDVLLDDPAATSMPLLVSPADVAQASAGRIAATDARLPGVCAAVSAAIRDFCGWHVAPSLTCELSTQVDTRVIVLPAKVVSSIDKVEVGGHEVSDFEMKRAGLLRLPGCPEARGRWGAYTITYTAGLDTSATPLSQIATQVALNNLVAAPGVRSESVGQVSLSYNQLSDGVAGGVQLLSRDRELLRQYRLQPRM